MLAPNRRLRAQVLDLQESLPRWRALQEQAVATPFQTHEWCARLLEGPGRAQGAEPLIVLIRDEAGGRDLCLLPLMRIRRGGLRVITFADFGLSDYIFPVIAAGGFGKADLARVWPKVLQALPKADLVHFDKIIGHLESTENPLMGLSGLVEGDLSSWHAPLPENWADYEMGLSKKSRRALRRRTYKLAEFGRSRHIMVRGGADAGRMLDALRKVRKARFAALGRADAMDDPAIYAFYRDLVVSGASGMAIMSALELNGEIIAHVFGLLRERRFYMLALTFHAESEAIARCSPGLVLVHETMGALHKKGLRVYDFTIGDERYKRMFGAIREPLHEYMLPLSLKGRAYMAAKMARKRLRPLKARLMQLRAGKGKGG